MLSVHNPAVRWCRSSRGDRYLFKQQYHLRTEHTCLFVPMQIHQVEVLHEIATTAYHDNSRSELCRIAANTSVVKSC